MAKKVTPRIFIILLFLFLLLPLTFASHHLHHHAAALQGAAVISNSVDSHSKEKTKSEHGKWRRMMIGSVAPTCTYNECKGCKFKCRAEQVPVEGNDPINSSYHYKCLCHP